MLTGFFLLVKGGDWVVSGASGLAKSFGISELVVGLTVVALGTSLPEFIVSLVAAFKDSTEITIANVIGSNIANIWLILGISAAIYPLFATRGTVWKEIPFLLLATVALAIQANDEIFDGMPHSQLSRSEGMILVSFFAVFIYYILSIIASRPRQKGKRKHDAKLLTRFTLVMGAGLLSLLAGGYWVVEGAVLIARKAGVSETLIGLTVVAGGTSLPELAASAAAAWRKNADIAIGNVVGSSIFNILFVLAFCSIVHPLPFESGSNVDVIVMLAATVMLFAVMFVGKPRNQMQRLEGVFFVLCYMSYITYTVLREFW